MEYETRYDCYNGEYKLDGNHDDPDYIENHITLLYIAYIYLPSNPLNRVEVIIRDHDDISLPCFYILNEDRSKELYKVSLFDNSITDGLSKEDKMYLNEFIRGVRDNKFKRVIFKVMKDCWKMLNDPDNDDIYNEIDPPVYI